MSTPITPAGGVEEPVGRQPSRAHPDRNPAPTSPDRRPDEDPHVRSGDRTPIPCSPGGTPSTAGPPVAEGPPPTSPPVTGIDHRQVLVRQRERFGGVKVGSAFFGWLTATGLAAILVGVSAAVGAATGTTVDQAVQASPPGTDRSWTVGLVGGLLLLVILFVAYLAGGYVAGRMARFNGARQGLAVWLWGVAITGLLAAVAAVAGSQYDILAQVNLPRIRTDELDSALRTPIAIAVAAAIALTGAVLGGLAGMRFHRRVDRADTTQASDVDTRSG